MDELKPCAPFAQTIEQTAMGTITTLETTIGVSHSDTITHQGQCLFATTVYTGDGIYDKVYTVMDTDGSTQSYAENEGILPTLFHSPAGETYVSVSPYHPDKEQEISIPVFNRTGVVLPKPNRPFVGDYAGVSEPYAILYDVDPWSDTKPDKLLAIEFKDGHIKKKHNRKVPLPRKNKVRVANHEIHLLARDERKWLHRQIDGMANELRRRTIQPNQPYYWQILQLSFDTDSYILSLQGESLSALAVEVITPDGSCTSRNLIDIDDELFNTWPPVEIAAGTYAVRFNTEFGNGWFTLKDGELLEFFYSKGVQGYRNLLTGEVWELNEGNLIISGLVKTVDHAYAVVCYPRTADDVKNKRLVVLNRQLSR